MEENEFYFDVLLDTEDYCNRKNEINLLMKLTEEGRKYVVYAPRRYGKSSLVKNVIGGVFQKKKNWATIYVNLMEVQSIENISERIGQALSETLQQKFPLRSTFQHLIQSFKGLSLNISIDPTTQAPSLEIAPSFESPEKNLSQVFAIIRKWATDNKLFLIFDEFQDIVDIPQAAGLIRHELQQMKHTPMAFLGSKRDLLNQLFANNKSPFFSFGDEITLPSISPEDWLNYFNKRLAPKTITSPAMTLLCEQMNHVPNAICEVGAFLKSSRSQTTKNIDERQVLLALEKLIKNKESTYRTIEGLFSEKEQSLLRVIAHRRFLLKPTEHSVLIQARLSSGAIIKMLSRMTHKGWVEMEQDKGYRISDPLLSHFIKIKSPTPGR